MSDLLGQSEHGEVREREIVAASNLWQNVALFLGGVVLSLSVVWASFIRDSVSRSQMENYVQTQAPYLRFKPSIDDAISQLKANQKEIQQQNDRQSEEILELRIQIAQLKSRR